MFYNGTYTEETVGSLIKRAADSAKFIGGFVEVFSSCK